MKKCENCGSNKTKRTVKTILRTVCILLVCVFTCSAIGFLSGGFTNRDVKTWFEKDRNPDNLIDNKKYTVKDGATFGKGISLVVKDDGVIKFSGKATSDNEFTLTVLTLPAGTYTISGCASGVDTWGLRAQYGNEAYYAGTDSDTFVLTAETDVSIIAYINTDQSGLGKVIYPVLNSGEEPVSFYTK